MIKVFNMNLELIKKTSTRKAMATGSFPLPRRQFWADFVYKSDDPMVLAE